MTPITISFIRRTPAGNVSGTFTILQPPDTNRVQRVSDIRHNALVVLSTHLEMKPWDGLEFTFRLPSP